MRDQLTAKDRLEAIDLEGVDQELKTTAKHTAMFLVGTVAALTVATEFFIGTMNALKM